VRTAIEVHASPEKVWQEVVAFSEIPAPTEWMFRAGVAYPIRAQVLGSGVGAERHCVISTGAFVEPIEVWDEPRLLKFSVTSNPAPMEEWTPYSHIDPPHLQGFLVSEGRTVFAHAIGRRRHAGGRRNLIPAWALAGRILADVVGCDDSPDSFARAKTHSG
jgi:hypothetical protein